MALQHAGDAALLAGANAAMLGAELIQFGRAEPLGQGRYRLSRLLRGRGGSDDAIRNAIETASKTLRKLEWFEVQETRGHLADGKVAHWQVRLRVAFRLESD